VVGVEGEEVDGGDGGGGIGVDGSVLRRLDVFGWDLGETRLDYGLDPNEFAGEFHQSSEKRTESSLDEAERSKSRDR